ncbi:molecular chaperone TorD [Paenalcaligenes hominis]|uniref:Molecular chaperone TorD n=1 Tax=Paenalcaligenes hominis TaxID=643674 RepID=A0A1U9JYU9_9BURK|nr:molecular chaperone TorD [Paenalcaligenes hominis]AQS50948.1 molecular chaperone TorD [Paenalcaligenes hominis]
MHQDNALRVELTPTEINELRAQVYTWLGHQFLYELSDEQWAAFLSGQLQPFFDLLSDYQLTEPVQQYQQALQQAADQFQSQVRLIVASDYTHAFLLDAKESALPYASAYEDDNKGMLYGASSQVMQAFLAESGWALAKELNEPADHLSVYLAALAAMAAHTADAALTQAYAQQLDFIDVALLPWLIQFVQRTEQVVLESAVYPALAQLLLAYVQQDRAYLQLVLSEVS